MEWIASSVRWALTVLLILSCNSAEDDVGATRAALGIDASIPPDGGLPGSGTASSPFLICTCADLQRIDDNLRAHYRLVCDVDCSGFDAGDGRGFRPLGRTAPFRGVLDGNAHTITDLSINRAGEDEVGLFDHVQGGNVFELGLERASIVGRDRVGGLAGSANGASVREVFVRGAIAGGDHVGGLIGSARPGSGRDTTIDDSYTQASVSCTGSHCGLHIGSLRNSAVAHGYSVGVLTALPALAGSTSRSATVSASFFDCDVTGGCSASDPTAATTSNLQSPFFLIGAGWDFGAVWGIRGAAQYVCLQWEPGCSPCASADAVCDGFDEDCDGAEDEDFVSVPTSCGVGECAASGATSCVAGSEVDSCTPGAPAANDPSCDDRDQDCDSVADEDFPSSSTTCGIGACAATGATSCASGVIQDSCAPGAPAPSDPTCDAVDDDCDTATDEDFVGGATSCGVGACGSTGLTSCVAGTIVDSCTPGAPAPSDAVCDAIDEDCDGTADEDFPSSSTSCGVGACGATGATACVAGAVQDSCTPGTPAPVDSSCDAVDDDCDGTADEGFAGSATSCGVGACGAAGTTSCVSGTIVDSCTPGVPGPADATCDGVDQDCDGILDEDFIGSSTMCGVGACVAGGALVCAAGAILDTCVPGTPAPDDSVCNGIDDDCDGAIDEDPACAVERNPPTWPAGALIVVCSTPLTTATVEWTEAVDDVGVVSYRVFVDGMLDQVVLAPLRTATITGLTPASTVALSVQAVDAAGNVSTDGPGLTYQVPFVPPDPSTVAPPLDPTGVTPLFDSISFLFSLLNPIQQGVAPATIDPERAALVFGSVLEVSGAVVPGVRVRVLDHPELGNTFTRADGRFDLVVNGGGPLHLVYERAGFLEVQRTVEVPWDERVAAPDVVLTRIDRNPTRVELATIGDIAVARGSVVTDTNGPRQTTLLFHPGTSATMAFPDGRTEPLTALDVRTTEFTVGPNGPDAMPAIMPEQIAYMYAVEFSVDQAIARGASRVDFSRPVSLYVENFVSVPVGTFVPLGSYDQDRAAWVPDVDGLVIGIVSTAGGIAAIDLDGDGVSDTDADLTAAGFDAAERRKLAEVYSAGTELWRLDIPHFTMPWDCNWGFGPPVGSSSPGDVRPDITSTPEPCEAAGSIILCENQSIAEEIPVLGTPFALRYQSDRVPGRRDGFEVAFPLIEGDITFLKRAGATLNVAGQVIGVTRTQAEIRAVGRDVSLTWDGRDAYGRALPTGAPATLEVCHRYQAQPLVVSAGSAGGAAAAGRGRGFGDRPGDDGLTVTTDRAGSEIELCRSSGEFWLRGIQWDARPLGLGGFHLDGHHLLDSDASVFVGGDGSFRREEFAALTTVAGNGSLTPADGVPALDAFLQPEAIAVAPDGTLYISHRFFEIFRVDSAGVLRRFAGTGLPGASPGEHTEDAPAVSSPIGSISGMTFGPDGSLYIAESNLDWIRRITPDGRIQRVAGPPASDGFGNRFSSDAVVGDGGLATAANIDFPAGVAVDSDGTIYIADFFHFRIRRVAPDGFISTAMHDPGATIQTTGAVEVAEDGAVYFSSTSLSGAGIRRLNVDSTVPLFVSGPGNFDDGLPAGSGASCGEGRGGFGLDRRSRIVCATPFFVRRIEATDRIFTIAGNGEPVTDPRAQHVAVPASATPLAGVFSVTTSPDGVMYAIVSQQVVLIEPGAAAAVGYPDPSGQLLYQFDRFGHHLRTADALTGTPLLEYGYLPDGKIATILDADGNLLRVDRPAPGQTVITAPFGEQTLLFDDDGDQYADRVGYAGDPSGRGFAYTYGTGSQSGLLLASEDRGARRHEYVYDVQGRVERSIAPGTTGQQLALVPVVRSTRIDGTDVVAVQSYGVDRTSAGGRLTRYRVTTHSDERLERSVTHPDGVQLTVTSFPDGRRTISRRDGTIIEEEITDSPRFGELRPYISRQTITLPSGQTFERLRDRTVEIDPAMPSRLLSWTEQFTNNGQTLTRTFDSTTGIIETTSPAGRTFETEIDSRGRPLVSRIPGFHPVGIQYDSRGRRARMSEGPPGAERIIESQYDADGDGREHRQPEVVVDALGQLTTLRWDALRRLTSSERPDGQVTSFAYDVHGNVAGVTPPARPTHRLDYGPQDEQRSYTPPAVAGGGTPMLWSYDQDLFPLLKTLPSGRTLAATVDPVTAQLRSITIGRGAIGFDYDAATGQLERTTMPDGQRTALTMNGHLLESAIWSGPVTGTVLYSYDVDLRLSGITVDTVSASFRYDSDALLVEAGPMVLSRDPLNGTITGTAAGAVSTAQVLNGFGDVERWAATWPAGTLTFDDAHDALGRIVMRTETDGSVTRLSDYTYDAANRLTDVVEGGVVRNHYEYDPQGNRVVFRDAFGSGTATYDDQDRLLRYGTETFIYNLDGQLAQRTNTATGATTSYDYDELDQLLTVTLPGGTLVEYRIDGFGRRVEKRVAGTPVRRWLYQDGLNPIAELDGAGNLVQLFVYGSRGHVPDLILRGGDIYRVVTDPLGSPRRIVDIATGAVVQALDYDAFGRVLRDTNPRFQPFGFAGGHYDSDTGLVRFGTRDYDSSTGRWTAKDSILFAGGDSDLYVYVGNDPVNLSDPNGRDWLENLCVLIPGLCIPYPIPGPGVPPPPPGDCEPTAPPASPVPRAPPTPPHWGEGDEPYDPEDPEWNLSCTIACTALCVIATGGDSGEKFVRCMAGCLWRCTHDWPGDD